ncbi:MAG TPA: VOC family protein [Actinomycetes bacterium]|nr:VOC family protein [Actinomycetes bacterium]
MVFEALDHEALARWWADALGWEVTFETRHEVAVEPQAGTPGIPLVFVPVPDAKTVPNRVHLDLASPSAEAQTALVDRLIGLGATSADVGQGEVPWVVLADPEGNELCVLEPRDRYRDTGPLAAVVMAAADPPGLARFWAEAAAWPVTDAGDQAASLRHPSGTGPFLELVRSPAPKLVKNRLHLDLAPYRGEDPAAEVARLLALGATRADVGQGEVTWTVLADPEGNELCVLSPR